MGERQFGPYRLVRQIAVGGMAEIHLAKTKGIAGFEKYVALKMIHPNFAEDEQFIQMLGVYPVGSMVELTTGEVGIVIAQNMVRRLMPRVMVVLDAKGAVLRPQVILDLANEPKASPGVPYRIKRTLEQGSVPIDPAEFFL